MKTDANLHWIYCLHTQFPSIADTQMCHAQSTPLLCTRKDTTFILDTDRSTHSVEIRTKERVRVLVWSWNFTEDQTTPLIRSDKAQTAEKKTTQEKKKMLSMKDQVWEISKSLKMIHRGFPLLPFMVFYSPTQLTLGVWICLLGPLRY